MKYIMDITSYWKLQFICHFSNFSNHFVGTIKPWFDIFWTFPFYGGLFVGPQPKINQVIHLEVSLHSMLICILFLLILGNLQVIFQNIQNLLTSFNPILIFWGSTTYTMKRELDTVLVFLSPNFSSYFYLHLKKGWY